MNKSDSRQAQEYRPPVFTYSYYLSSIYSKFNIPSHRHRVTLSFYLSHRLLAVCRSIKLYSFFSTDTREIAPLRWCVFIWSCRSQTGTGLLQINRRTNDVKINRHIHLRQWDGLKLDSRNNNSWVKTEPNDEFI